MSIPALDRLKRTCVVESKLYALLSALVCKRYARACKIAPRASSPLRASSAQRAPKRPRTSKHFLHSMLTIEQSAVFAGVLFPGFTI